MSEQNETPESEDKEGAIISPSEAAIASMAQAIAFSAQNEVDAFRNQNTVNMVTMGSAYAKWLENPMMGDEFSKIIGKTTLENEFIMDAVWKVIEVKEPMKGRPEPYNGRSPEEPKKSSEKFSEAQKVRLATKIFDKNL